MRALIALIALAMLQQPGVPAAVDTWTPVTPTYIGQPDPAGYLSPASYNVIAAYDAISKRTLHVDKWTDAAHGTYIYADAVLAYDPATNTVEMIKISNWKDGSTELPANATEPTPIDRHPLGGVVLDR